MSNSMGIAHIASERMFAPKGYDIGLVRRRDEKWVIFDLKGC